MQNSSPPGYSKTVGNTRQSKIHTLFLVQFDVKVGNKLVWYKSRDDEVDLNGIEYKALPSGISNQTEAVVPLSHIYKKEIFYGLGRFRQRILESETDRNDNQIARSDVKMFSLGIICKVKRDNEWRPNEFIQYGWEHISKLDCALQKFLDSEKFSDFTVFESLFEDMTSETLRVEGDIQAITYNPLNKIPALFHVLGPLVFTLYKQALLRKRILIFHQDSYKIDYHTAGVFTYLLSLLSLFPRSADTSVSGQYFSTPLYYVCLHDLNDLSEMTNSTISVTSDTILMYQENAYDFAVFLPSEENESPFILKAEDIVGKSESPASMYNKRVRASLNDYHNMKQVYKNTVGNFSPYFQGEDQTSIKTTDSNISSDNSTIACPNYNPAPINEPSWWYNEAVESMSWMAYIWNAFSWFASAGAVYPEFNNIIESESSSGDIAGSSRDGATNVLLPLLEVVFSFHKITNRLITIVNESIEEEIRDVDCSMESIMPESPDPDNSFTTPGKVDLELSCDDMELMGLDPYSRTDLDFITGFVREYWGPSVDTVDVCTGIFSLC
ncbi:Piso0_001094 [Millerozyma farinosa CBS 7064]|uniref:Piso0_001094 protein n=1 Tax=Pichia sorbitophila (strain ATCC MYA-4447 / BCRC 22081 / CBS 7064 / NBRC 10061 / NRRL Y-12695) TaxID=559304 RepID=G8YSD4_PICSO|nr:Piso0_001094 [Millerozyma farinosa CBS 7064]CCE79057.1 Piso0_001094 [Millerozyma farinosa CBS 7064]